MNHIFGRLSAVVLLSLGLATSAQAGMYVPPEPACLSHAVTIPCDGLAWDFGFESYFFQPGNNDLWIATEKSQLLDPANTTQNASNVVFDFDYEWAFRIEASVHFWAGRDITVNWTHMKDRQFNRVEDGIFVQRIHRRNGCLLYTSPSPRDS